jgi:hypothetical protein
MQLHGVVEQPDGSLDEATAEQRIVPARQFVALSAATLTAWADEINDKLSAPTN